MRELDDWHSDRPRHGRDAGADAHARARHVHDGPKHAAQRDMILKMLLTFCPGEREWWEYLDQIWDTAETAERTDLKVLPTLMLRAREQPHGSVEVS